MEKILSNLGMFSPVFKCNFVNFLEVSGNKCKPSLTKAETLNIVVLMHSTNCRFADYRYLE